MKTIYDDLLIVFTDGTKITVDKETCSGFAIAPDDLGVGYFIDTNGNKSFVNMNALKYFGYKRFWKDGE